jgi:hypothetical protein
MTTFRVDVPLMLTVEVECHDAATARHAIDQAFHVALASDPLTGVRFKLEHDLIIPTEAVIRMAVATDAADVVPS